MRACFAALLLLLVPQIAIAGCDDFQSCEICVEENCQWSLDESKCVALKKDALQVFCPVRSNLAELQARANGGPDDKIVEIFEKDEAYVKSLGNLVATPIPALEEFKPPDEATKFDETKAIPEFVGAAELDEAALKAIGMDKNYLMTTLGADAESAQLILQLLKEDKEKSDMFIEEEEATDHIDYGLSPKHHKRRARAHVLTSAHQHHHRKTRTVYNSGGGGEINYSFELEADDRQLFYVFYRPKCLTDNVWANMRLNEKEAVKEILHFRQVPAPTGMQAANDNTNAVTWFVQRYTAMSLVDNTLRFPTRGWGDVGVWVPLPQADLGTNFHYEKWVKVNALAIPGTWNAGMQQAAARLFAVFPAHAHQEVTGEGTYELAHSTFERDLHAFWQLMRDVKLLWGELPGQFHTSFLLPDNGNGGPAQDFRARYAHYSIFVNDYLATNMYKGGYGQQVTRFTYTGALGTREANRLIADFRARTTNFEVGAAGNRVSDYKYSCIGVRAGIYGNAYRVGYEFRQYEEAMAPNLLTQTVQFLRDQTGPTPLSDPNVQLHTWPAVAMSAITAYVVGPRALSAAGMQAALGLDYAAFRAKVLAGLDAACGGRCGGGGGVEATALSQNRGGMTATRCPGRWPFVPSLEVHPQYTCGVVVDQMLARWMTCLNTAIMTLQRPPSPNVGPFASPPRVLNPAFLHAGHLNIVAGLDAGVWVNTETEFTLPGCAAIWQVMTA